MKKPSKSYEKPEQQAISPSSGTTHLSWDPAPQNYSVRDPKDLTGPEKHSILCQRHGGGYRV
eukprot:2354308-Karenia_brevis.AAC.1